MKAIVIGATGATGKTLVSQLLDDSDFTEVVIFARRQVFDDHPKLVQNKVIFDQLDKYADQITGDVAFSCLGTTLKAAGSKEVQWTIDFDYQYHFAELSLTNKIPLFVLLSSAGADEKSKIFYSRMKGTLENKIEKLGFPNLLIFQPGPLIRPQTDRFGERISIPLIKFFNKLGVLRRFRPIHVDDLAAAMIAKSKVAREKVERISLKDIEGLIKKNKDS